MKQFATCHCHPQSLDSGSTPESFALREKELGSGVLTCTDHGTLSAAYTTYSLAKKHGLTAVIGLEAYFRDDNCPILLKQGIVKTDTVPRGMDKDEWKERNPEGSLHDYLKYMHLTLHFADYDAYLCGVRLLSKADGRAERHGKETKALFNWDDIEELASHNVTATSSCLIGMVQRHLFTHQNTDAAKAYYQRLHHLFGERFYTEVFPHVCSHNFDETVFLDVQDSKGSERLRHYLGKTLVTNVGEIKAEQLADTWKVGCNHRELIGVKNYRVVDEFDEPKQLLGVEKFSGYIQNECKPWAPNGDVQYGCNKYVIGLSKKHKTKILIGDDSHFSHPEEKIVQDVRLAQQGPWRFSNSYHRQSSREAFEHFNKHMGVAYTVFEGWIDNTLEWSSKFKDFEMESVPRLPTNFYNKDTLSETKRLIKKHGRMPKDPVYLQRLKDEIDLLHRNGKLDLLPYFFIDEEVCRFYSDGLGELTGPGRGSAAGLLLTYLLGITHVDPIKYGLSMNRFITKDRILSGKLPDIDQDLPRRDPLVGWDVDVVRFEAEDGTVHTVPSHAKFETDQGLMTIEQAATRGADIQPWWNNES